MIEKTKKSLSKMVQDKNMLVVNILLLYMGLIMLGVFYDSYGHNADELPPKAIKKHIAISETTGENLGTVIAVAKEQDGHCEYRACNGTICDWYDNSNQECDNMNKGDWTAIYENTTYKGISLCSETKGEFAKAGNPSQKKGAHCWCKTGKHWVHHLFLNTASYCSDNGCAGNCAHGALYSPVFRSALNSRIQKIK